MLKCLQVDLLPSTWKHPEYLAPQHRTRSAYCMELGWGRQVTWSKEEDEQLRWLVTCFGVKSWKVFEVHIPGRTGEQVSLPFLPLLPLLLLRPRGTRNARRD